MSKAVKYYWKDSTWNIKLRATTRIIWIMITNYHIFVSENEIERCRVQSYRLECSIQTMGEWRAGMCKPAWRVKGKESSKLFIKYMSLLLVFIIKTYFSIENMIVNSLDRYHLDTTDPQPDLFWGTQEQHWKHPNSRQSTILWVQYS